MVLRPTWVSNPEKRVYWQPKLVLNLCYLVKIIRILRGLWMPWIFPWICACAARISVNNTDSTDSVNTILPIPDSSRNPGGTKVHKPSKLTMECLWPNTLKEHSIDMSGRLQRHYCKCCNAWMDDNKSSRQIHEGGRYNLQLRFSYTIYSISTPY